MRLYLSSYRWGEAFDELLGMVGDRRRVALVSNALDLIPMADRLAYARKIHDPAADLRDAGLDPFDLDLRAYFGKPAGLAAALQDVGLVWAAGGNSFLLRRAMRQSGFDAVIARLLAADVVVYGGWSAGAAVAGPSLRGIDLMDAPDDLTDGYDSEPVWEGLGLIDQAIVPHVRSDHPEAEDAARSEAFMIAQGLPHIALRDGEVVIRQGDRIEVRRISPPA